MKNVRDAQYGAIGDGYSHPLSDLYVSLADAQIKYPHAKSLSDELDWAAIQLAINENDPDHGGEEIIIPPGKYLAGGLVITRPSLLKGSSTFRGVQTSILVKENQKGIEITRTITQDGSGTIIQNLSVEPENELLKSGTIGVHVNGANGVIIDTVNVFRMDSHGIEISNTAEKISNSNSWQLINCYSSHNGENGLYVHGGDSQAGTCIALHVTGNKEWGVRESSFLGNTYISCVAESNGTVEGGELVQGGSYTVLNSVDEDVTPANYSSFFNCYAEMDNPPDFRLAIYVSIFGGNLCFPFNKWNVNLSRSEAFSGVSRLGFTWSKQKFRESHFLSHENSEGPSKEVGIDIPAASQTHNSVMALYYRPPEKEQEVYNPNTENWESDTSYKMAYWHLRRDSKKEGLINDSGNSHYNPNSHDRCWLLHELYPVEGGVRPVFGWTDRQHPIGGGHFFFGKPIANQKNYFSYKQKINLPRIESGINIVNSDSEFLNHWLNNKSLVDLIANFSIELGPSQDMSVPLIVGAHQFDSSTGHFSVQVVNLSDSPILNHEIYLNCHFERFKMWPDTNFKK